MNDENIECLIPAPVYPKNYITRMTRGSWSEDFSVDNGERIGEQYARILRDKCADYVIDLGLEGGEIVVQGLPEEIIKSKKSHTAKYLKRYLA